MGLRPLWRSRGRHRQLDFLGQVWMEKLGAEVQVGGPQDALFHLEQALSWLEDDDPERDEVGIRAAEAAAAGGDTLRAVRLLKDSIDHPGPRQRPEMRAELLARYATLSRMLDLPVVALRPELL